MLRLIETRLKLKPAKCSFVREEVSYLGHVIMPKGLQVSDQHVSAVGNFPRPKGIKGVWQFLGLCSFCRKFVPSFAKIVQPLHYYYSLTSKNTEFVRSEECQHAFEYLKGKLVMVPVLAYPNIRSEFILETDASWSRSSTFSEARRWVSPPHFLCQQSPVTVRKELWNYRFGDTGCSLGNWSLATLPIQPASKGLH